jgi:hypothetical protein
MSKEPRTHLWRAVIQQALIDATLPLMPSAAKRLSARMNQKRAREWFLESNRDFEEVCGMAGLEPSRVRSHAIPLIEEATRLDPPMPQPRPTITHNGETMSLVDWSKRTGIHYCTLHQRLKAGWPAERILTPKLYTRGPKYKPELQAESIAQ